MRTMNSLIGIFIMATHASNWHLRQVPWEMFFPNFKSSVFQKGNRMNWHGDDPVWCFLKEPGSNRADVLRKWWECYEYALRQHFTIIAPTDGLLFVNHGQGSMSIVLLGAPAVRLLSFNWTFDRWKLKKQNILNACSGATGRYRRRKWYNAYHGVAFVFLPPRSASRSIYTDSGLLHAVLSCCTILCCQTRAENYPTIFNVTLNTNRLHFSLL